MHLKVVSQVQLNANATIYIMNFSRSALIFSGEGIMQGPNLSTQQRLFCIRVALQSSFESDVLLIIWLSDDETLFQDWINRTNSAKLRISIINWLSNRWGPPIIDVEIPSRFLRIAYLLQFHSDFWKVFWKCQQNKVVKKQWPFIGITSFPELI